LYIRTCTEWLAPRRICGTIVIEVGGTPCEDVPSSSCTGFAPHAHLYRMAVPPSINSSSPASGRAGIFAPQLLLMLG